MVYLISNEFDISTQRIIFWLKYMGKDYKLLFLNEVILDSQVVLNNSEKFIKITTQTSSIDFNLKLDTFFYRKGMIKFSSTTENLIPKPFATFIENEQYTLLAFLETQFFEKSNVKTVKELNKLHVLSLAADVGLKIPNTSVIGTRQKLLEFYYENKENIIVKPIYEGLNLKLKDGFLKTFTSKLSLSKIKKFNKKFHPCLFQAEVNKFIEIRSFYLKKSIYSMAIFSQSDEMTSVDFRNYNPNRKLVTTPFKLPRNLENKIIRLFNMLNLETGSIDFCLDTMGQFIFLEINPVGQYGMLRNCNYNLDKLIAKEL